MMVSIWAFDRFGTRLLQERTGLDSITTTISATDVQVSIYVDDGDAGQVIRGGKIKAERSGCVTLVLPR